MEWIPKEAIAPIFTGIFLVITGLIAFVTSRRNTRTGAREARAPDVQEMWAQQEADRRIRHLVENRWWNLHHVFQGYYRRVISKADRLGLSPEDRAVFDLTPKEQAVIDSALPEAEEPA